MLKNLPGLKWLWLVGLGVVLDQVSKNFVTKNMAYAEIKSLFPGLNLTLSHNPGIAFGWFSSHEQLVRISLLVTTFIVTLALLLWMLKTPKTMKLQAVALALIVGGAIGNLIDRAKYGYVVDFIDVFVGASHWPTFNVADSLITIGTAGLVYMALFNKE
jgi:signal peptidase II